MRQLSPIAFVTVDDQRIDAELLQPRGDRKPGLSAADDNDSRVVIGVGACLGKAVAPVLGAEVADAVVRLRGALLQGLFVASEFFQRCHKCPG